MTTLDALPNDQRAVLTLVLGRGRSYAQIAGLLAIEPGAVSGRAGVALDALGPPTEVAPADRQLICDYLLGQLPDDEVTAARAQLARSAPSRTWARAVADELAPLLAGPLPEIPTGAPSPPAAPVAPPAEAAPPAPDSFVPDIPAIDPAPAAAAAARSVPDAGAPGETASAAAPPPAGEEPKRSSRRGGVAVIVITAIVIAAVAVILLRHHSTGHESASGVTATNPAAATNAQTTASSSTTGAGSAQPIAQINLDPATSGSQATAIAEVLQNGSQREIAIIGQHIPANSAHNAYAVWLYNSQRDALRLGFVSPGVSANGKLSTAAPLPSSAGRYRRLVITTETAAKPKSPGPILLSGTITGL